MKDDGVALLSLSGITKRFGRMEALSGVSMSVERGEVVALIGPNGSGKTTLLNVISGLLFADEGTILFEGKRIDRLPPHSRSRLGVNRTFQMPHPFSGLSVLENVLIAARFGRHRHEDDERLAESILKLTGLSAFADTQSGSLNTGQKKMLDLAKALATGPKLLLVDEIAAGLSHGEMESISKLLGEVARTVEGMIVVEHVMGFIRMVTERVVVLDAGTKIFDGSFSDAVRDEHVREVYIGKGKDP